MPSSISFNGVRTFRPGVYAVIDASALGQQGISTGNVAVVGDFPMLEQGKPMAFSSARAMSDYFLGDLDMQLLAKIAFSPSVDERIGGGASQLFVVNAAAVNQAQHTFLDSSGDPSLTIKSKLHGKAGNKVAMDINQNANGSAFDINVRYDGLSEEFVAVESGSLFTATYAGGAVATLSTSPSGVKLTEKFANDPQNLAGETTTPTPFSLPGVRAVSAVTATVGAGRAVTVEGLRADGQQVSEILVLDQDNVPKSTEAIFASVTQISVAALANGVAVDYTVDLLDLDTSELSSVAQIAEAVNDVPNFTAVKLAPNIGGIPADQLDEVSETLDAGVKSFRADVHAILKALEASSIIEASRAGTKPPAPVANVILSGGTHAAAVTAGYTSAFEELLLEDVQIAVPMSDSADVHLELVKHCKAAQLYGRERCGYVGTPAKMGLGNIFQLHTRLLNSRHVALVGQSIQYLMPNGTRKTLDPKFLALMVACMQAGSPVATPMTRKRPDILGVEQNDQWNLVLSNDEAIQKGILAISLDNLGLRIERSVTTYMTDDNPIYSEVSANESVNTSVRTLRARLEGQIGNPAVAGTRSSLENTVRVNLAKQVKDGIIKAFQNVLVEDKGDRFDIGYEVAAIEPLNFIKITANVVRIPG